MSNPLSATQTNALQEALARIQELEAENSALKQSARKSHLFEQLIQNTPGFFYECKNDEHWTMLELSH